MSLEIATVLSHLLDWPVYIANKGPIIGGNSPHKKTHYANEVDNALVPSIVDLFDVPFELLTDPPTLEAGARSRNLFHRDQEFAHLLGRCVVFSDRSLDELEADDDFRSFAHGRHDNFDLKANAKDTDVLLTNPTGYLGNYESIFYIDNPDTRHRVYRALRNLKPKQVYLDFVHSILLQLKEFSSVHIRLSDYKNWAFSDAESIAKNIQKRISPQEQLLILTDESEDRTYFSPILKIYPNAIFLDEFIVNENYREFCALPFHDNVVVALISQYIASRSRVFIGHPTSTFTGTIQRLRFFDFVDDEALYSHDHRELKLDSNLQLEKKKPGAKFTWNQLDLSFGFDLLSWGCRFPECAYYYNDVYFNENASTIGSVNRRDMMDPDCVPKPVTGWRLRKKRGNIYLAKRWSREKFLLNKSSSMLWKMLDGRRSMGQCIAALTAEYPEAATRITTDVPRLIQKFNSIGVLESDGIAYITDHTDSEDTLCVLYHAADNKPMARIQGDLLEASCRAVSPGTKVIGLFGELDFDFPFTNRWLAIDNFLSRWHGECSFLVMDCDMVLVKPVTLTTSPGTVICQSWPGYDPSNPPDSGAIDFFLEHVHKDSSSRSNAILKSEFLSDPSFVFPWPFIIHSTDLRHMARRMVEIIRVMRHSSADAKKLIGSLEMVAGNLYFRERGINITSLPEFGVCNDWGHVSQDDYSIIHYCQPISYKDGTDTHKTHSNFLDVLFSKPIDDIVSENIQINRQLVATLDRLLQEAAPAESVPEPAAPRSGAPNIGYVSGHTFINNFREDSVVVDLGSNHGAFTKSLLADHPNLRMVLVEANPTLADELKRSLGKRENVDVVNAAVGSESKNNIRFFLCSGDEGSSLRPEFVEKLEGNPAQSFVDVEMVTLSDLLVRYELDKIDLLKIDIEGGEWEILENLSDNDYQLIDQITVEFHDFLDSSLRNRTERCVDRLENMGYSFLHNGGDFMDGSPYVDCLFYKDKNFGTPATDSTERSVAGDGAEPESGIDSHSQLGQDLWVLQQLHEKREGYFVDIGAADGVELSNTYLLEDQYDWQGIAVEPNPIFFDNLRRNRNCLVDDRCVVSADKCGDKFDLVLDGHLSALTEYANAVLEVRHREYKRAPVVGISLNALLDYHNAPEVMDYLSIDIEGGEYAVLKDFDFDRYIFRAITVEVNTYLGKEQVDNRDKIRQLLEQNSYRFIKTSDDLEIDDFYVHQSCG